MATAARWAVQIVAAGDGAGGFSVGAAWSGCRYCCSERLSSVSDFRSSSQRWLRISPRRSATELFSVLGLNQQKSRADDQTEMCCRRRVCLCTQYFAKASVGGCYPIVSSLRDPCLHSRRYGQCFLFRHRGTVMSPPQHAGDPFGVGVFLGFGTYKYLEAGSVQKPWYLHGDWRCIRCLYR